MSETIQPAPVALRRAIERYGLLVILDIAAILVSYGLALLLRFEWSVPRHYVNQFLSITWALAIVHCAANVAWGLYSRLWRYASAQDALSIVAAGATASSGVVSIDLLIPGRRPLPLSVAIIGGIFTIGALGAIRYRRQFILALLTHLQQALGSLPRHRVLVVGAGQAGQLLARQLQHPDYRQEYELVGFVDDDPQKQGLRLHGATVLGGRNGIIDIARQRRVDLIIIAIHRISGPDFRHILSLCQQTQAQIKVLPDVVALLTEPSRPGADGLLSIRDVEPQDLLGRREILVDEEACSGLLQGRVILVTGASGSIGSELCRQILRFGPQRLLMVDKSENGLFTMQLMYKEYLEESGLSEDRAACVIADVTDRDRMEALIASERPQIIFHAAAYKHVPLMEAYPQEAVRVNIGGTRLLCHLAEDYGVERFVLISTDKAVYPTSAMGFSKRIGELLILALSSSSTLFTAVRFVNVLGSEGSVIPTFAHEIAKGGPVTITDRRMKRYFMTPTEAVSLIIQAATLTRGGDIFLLDMGQEIRIVDLAEKMIRLKGLRVGKDIDIVYTGIRPGEKLEEELIHRAIETPEPTGNPGILRLTGSKRPSLSKLLAEIYALERLARTGRSDAIRAQMAQIVTALDRPLS
jgi:FlaA1/EpsC-like NDP-sugar epimerase